MPVDQRLELHTLLPALVEQGMVTFDVAQRLSTLAPAPNQHPLECIAAQGPCLETLTQWLAQRSGQSYLRIDPLKIDVATLVPLMSHAFAQRHGILAVAVDAQSVTVASAEPYVCAWEAGLAQVLKRSIKRVVANPQAIQRCIGEFYRLAKSVSGADQTTPAPGHFDLLNLGGRRPGAGCQRRAYRQYRRLAVAVRVRPAGQRYPHRAVSRPGPRAFSHRWAAA